MLTEKGAGTSRYWAVFGRTGPRRVIWVVWLGLLVFAAGGLGGYRVENSIEDWSPGLAGHAGVSTYVVIGGGTDVLTGKRLVDLKRGLTALGEVSLCVTPGGGSGLGSFFKFRKAQPGPGRGGAVFDDPGYTGLFCFARAGVRDERFLGAVRGELRRELGDEAGGLALGGPAVFTTALNDWSQRRSPLMSGLVVLVGVLLLWWVVRDPVSVATSAVAIVGSQVMLAGMICRLGVRVDMVLSMVWPLMMALGFSFAAHRSLRRGVSGTLVLCGLTTAAGIVSFVFCSFPPIRSFALWGSVGLMLTWVSVMLLVRPAARVGGCGQPVGHVGFRWLRWMQRGAYGWSFGRPGAVVTGGVVLTLAGLACLPLLEIQNAPVRYFPRDSRVYRDYKQLDRRLIGMLPFEVTVREAGVGAGVGAGQGAGQGDVAGMLLGTPGVRLVVDISLLDIGAGRTYLCFADGAGLGRLVAAQRGWRAWAGKRGLEIKWSGVAAQLQDMSSGVTRVAATAVPAMVLLASVVVWLVGGCDWRLALIGAWVNFFPVASLIVLLVLLGFPISLPSLMIGAITVGAAVDDTLHIVRGLRKGGGVRRVLIGCWRPCVGSSLVTAACMSVFVLSPFGPTHQFGVLMAVTVIAALVGDMLLLPAAIVLMKRCPDLASPCLSSPACTGSVSA